MTPGITAIVLTRNEERHIRACLEALAWADERVVLDSLSTDATTAIAAGIPGVRVAQRPFDTYARQRNAALDLAHCPWVFFVDADERVSPALAQEAREAVAAAEATAGPDAPVGFWVPRQNYILGRWVRHAGWWPDGQLRLLRRGRARYDEARDPHEIVLLDGPEARLRAPLIHYNYESVRQFITKQRAYARREGRTLRASGQPLRPRALITQPLREFHRRFIVWEGYKEGGLGLLLSLLMAWYRLQVQIEARRAPAPDAPFPVKERRG
jgi:(heptosyl)LPS beta-1,4-glucosyltransferase